MTDRREYMREYNRKYNEKNKEKKAEYNKKYHEKNKEKNKDKRKEYYEKNKDKIKEYREKNKEKIAEYHKEYKQTPAGIKTQRISNWKNYGIICDDWDVLYERYLNTEFCELCNVELTEDKVMTKTTRCLDHCHETGEFRNILCNLCNLKRG